MCKMSRSFLYRCGARSQTQCRVLERNPNLAPYVRYSPPLVYLELSKPVLTVQRTLMVDFADNPPKTPGRFVKCLTTLPNLHTLEIVSMQGDEKIQSFAIALERTGTQLQVREVRTLVLPPTAHQLLRHCPNVEDLTCCATEPDEDSVESLAACRSNRVAKFSVLHPGYRNIWPSRILFHSSSFMERTHKNSHRNGCGLSGDS